MQHPDQHNPQHATSVLIITCISSFLTPFNGSSINIALPSIGSEFTADAITLSWIATSFLLATAIFMVPLGRLADIYGMKKMIITGLIVYVSAALLAAVANSIMLLLAARVIQGIASAMISSTSSALLVLTFPLKQRGRVLGINVAVMYVGLSLGPFVGGLLTQALGWRSIFWLITALGIIPVVMIFWLLKGEWAAARGEKFDLPGSIIYGLGLVALIWGFSSLPDWTGFAAVALSIMIIGVFVKWELKVKSPALDIKHFIINRGFAFANLAALINYAATYAVTFLLSLYLQYIKGLPPGNAGLVILVMPVIQAVFSPITGRLSDRFDPRLLASTGMALTMAGLLLLVFLDGSLPLYYIIISLIVLGLGFALFSSPNTNSVMSSVNRESLAVASATLGTMRLIGQMLSMGTAMLVLAVIIGHTPITETIFPQFELSVKICFGIFTVLCFGGIFASMARGQARR